ncbi:MAG: cation:proton antiporter [Myxococcales bacterium]|nr:cation:proton antiporter [Myxococcales bacterium]
MHGALITDLAIVTVVAAFTGLLARRIGQPSILGYLLAGLIVGPYIPVPLFADPHRMGELAEVGVVLVMFAVGLEFRVRRLLEILPVSGLTAVIQIAALWWAGFTVGSLLDWSTPASVCLGAMVAISSTMVVSAVLRGRPIDPDVRSHVFGILVVQDVVAIVLMAIVTALAAGESLGMRSLGVLVAQLAGVVVGMLVVGLLILPRLVRYLLRQGDAEGLVVLVAGAAFGLAMAANLFGFSVALGAFIAGMAVAESGRGHDVEELIEPLRALFSAIFFVSIGMTVDPVVAWRSLPLALGLCALVVGMQWIAVVVGTVLTGGSLRRGVYAGLALGQIGELSFILATIAIAGGVVPKETLPALVTVATITAFTTPLLLGRAQRLVETLDRRLPDRVQQVLAAYQAFVRRIQTPGDGPSLRRPALATLLDWAALLIIIIATSTVVRRVDPDFKLAVNAGALVLAAPFVVGLIRSGRKLAAGIRVRVGGAVHTTILHDHVEALALAAGILGVGLPTLALVRPFLGSSWIEATLLALLLLTLVLLGLRVGGVQGEHTSGVARLALDLAGHVQDDAPHPTQADAGPLAGLDYHPLPIAAGNPADGQTLAQLDLRCRTGATVIAICRGEVTITLPTGHERLQAGDTLAVSGSPEALQRAQALLTADLYADDPRDPA